VYYVVIDTGEAGINVHDVLPVTTPRGKQTMPPADRIYDSGQGAKKDLTDTGDDFLAIGQALRIMRIMQLNVEGLSAAKREFSSIAERQKIVAICLEETHVDVDKTNRFSIAGFDLLTYSLHAKYGRATYIRDNISDAHHVILRIIIKIDATRCQILRLKCTKIFPLPCI